MADSKRDEQIAVRIGDAGFCVTDDFLTRAHTQALERVARRYRDAGAFRHAGVGRGQSFRLAPEIRSDRVRWLQPPGENRVERRFLDRMEALRRALNRELYLGLAGFEAHYALYPPGSRYRTHRDRFANASHRIVSAIVYLNAGWEAPRDGGALRLYLGEADRPPFEDVAPLAGRLVCFSSERFPHEVLEARRERLSLTGWFTVRL